jgi:hypothetical protein
MMGIQDEITPEQAEAILMEYEERKAWERLEEWRNKGCRRGYAIHSMEGGKIGVRLYQFDLIQQSFVGRSLSHAVEVLMKGETN